jgi:hypothetical protein
MDLASIIVPVHVYAKVLVSVPVDGTFVVFLKNLCEMVGMLLPNILDAKVVDTESEQERPPVMFPKAQCDVALMVAMLVEAFFREILCKDAHLRETIHALLYFDVDCTVVGSQVVVIVGFDKIGREVADLHAHVLRLAHWGVEVEILQVDGAIACVLC